MAKGNDILWVLGLFVLNSISVLAQEPIQNFGNLKIHENGALGFHHDLINNGSFDENLGLAGFFNDNDLIVSGVFRPIFNDVEIMVEENIFLDIGIGIKRHLNFIDGTFITPRTSLDVNIDYFKDAFYSGENNSAKINGYSMMTEKLKFRFPIGDNLRIRPLLLEMETDTVSAKSAYFFENPNAPSTFTESFDTDSLGENLFSVSKIEFWHLQSIATGRVELIWDDRSNISDFNKKLEDLVVVGWHMETKEWHNLGVAARKGDLTFGRMVSNYFDTSEYHIITFGSGAEAEGHFLSNYLLTANNDGINDFLVIKAIEESPNNLLKVFNRWGRSVYNKENYNNEFNGKSNTGLTLRKGKILPAGIYFYVIELKNLDVIHQGYLYITD